jgi:hypothetical protein
MNAVNRESILSKTHYGLNIYSHILRLYYPDEIVLRLLGRDCGLCRNPFNADKETLHIFIEKEKSCKREQSSSAFETMPSAADFARSENVLGNSLDREFARHEDSANAIPAGDAFDFVELHYKQQDDELLQTLNKELFLHIGEERNFYVNKKTTLNTLVPRVPNVPCVPVFSFFKAPITNTKPHSETTLRKIYNAIVGNYYKERTGKLRAISDVQQARKFKATNFDYCTFSGVFTTRNDKALIKHSGLLCVDFDHLQNLSDIQNRLLADEYFDTQLLFVSPSGNGLKWIISIDTAETAHGDYFVAVANYILQTYGIAVDKSGRDISRACFLPYDPQAFINPQLK